MDRPEELTELEVANAINRLIKRFVDCGWADKAAISKGKFHIGYTDLGIERMDMLKVALVDEMKAALTFAEFRALLGLVSAEHHKMPEQPLPPEE